MKHTGIGHEQLKPEMEKEASRDIGKTPRRPTVSKENEGDS